MKLRTDFVTNSSSSSFIITKGYTENEVYEALEYLVKAYNIATRQNYELDDIVDIYDCGDKGIKVESTYDNSIPWTVLQFLEDDMEGERTYSG